jgi:glycosyltransferase involved in cell wall biosynthesis
LWRLEGAVDSGLSDGFLCGVKILFVHQNMPGQFRSLAPLLARDPANKVAFITRREDIELSGVRRLSYRPLRAPSASTHRYVQPLEGQVLAGQQVARMCQELGREGFIPDVMVAHPGWGEALFLKDVFPGSPLLSYCEFYYRATGSDVDFGAEAPPSLDTACRLRMRNSHLLAGLESCDAGVSPTHWQKMQHPRPFHDKIEVIFDGIDTSVVRPNPAARFRLPNGRELDRDSEVITYVARNLEPYRGFPSFVRAIPGILRRRPNAQIVIVGGDEVSYGQPPAGGGTWREVMAREVPLDPARVHYVGRIPYARYLSLLQVSSVHVYLTVPFVLSWSVLEALAAGCLVVASATPPVQEVIEDGRNGILTDFFSPDRIAEAVAGALDSGPQGEAMRVQARETVLASYDLARCLPRQIRLLETLAGRRMV